MKGNICLHMERGRCDMKKRIFMVAMALFVSTGSMPLQVGAAGVYHHCGSHWNYDDYNWYDNSYWYDDNDDDDDWYYDDDGDWYYNDDTYDDNWYDEDEDDDFYDDWYDDEMTVDDLAVNPSQKKIRIGENFYINVVPSADSGWEDLSEEEWDEICEENIESIEYHSMRSRVVSVNKFTGKVKAKKKGSAVIKTKITLVNDDSIIFKTKVEVSK